MIITLWNAILAGLVCSIITGLITFLIMTLLQKTLIEKKIERHEKKCIAPKNVMAIKTALIFLVTKQDGNLKDLGLIE